MLLVAQKREDSVRRGLPSPPDVVVMHNESRSRISPDRSEDDEIEDATVMTVLTQVLLLPLVICEVGGKL